MYFKVPADIYESLIAKHLPQPAIVHRFEHLLPYTGDVRAPELVVYSTPFAHAFSVRYFNMHGHESYLFPIPFDISDLQAIKASTPRDFHTLVTPADYTQCALFTYLCDVHFLRVIGANPYTRHLPVEQQQAARQIMFDNVHGTVKAYQNYLEALRCGSEDYANMAGQAHRVWSYGEVPHWRDVMVAA